MYSIRLISLFLVLAASVMGAARKTTPAEDAYAASMSTGELPRETAAEPVAPEAAKVVDEAVLNRGDYLVNVVMSCGSRGTPLGPDVYDEVSDSDLEAIAAYLRTVKPVPMPPAASRPHPKGDLAERGAYLGGLMNLDKAAFVEAGIASWSDEEISRAITTTVGRNWGRLRWYDVAAVVAWLRTLEPVRLATRQAP